MSWLDPASKEVWDYNIALAKDVFLHGFDEVNFDYVRFPSDGDMKNMGFPVYDGKILKSSLKFCAFGAKIKENMKLLNFHYKILMENVTCY